MALFASRKADNGDGADMSFFEHLDQLRPRLIRSIAVFALLAAACFAAKSALMSLLAGPELPAFPTNRLFAALADLLSSEALRINTCPLTLVNTSMAGQFNLHISLALHAALILCIPYALAELWGFVRPALTERERRIGRLLCLCVTLCFVAGLLFGYFVLAPLSVNFLSGYSVSDSIVNMIDIGSYLSLVLNLTFVSGVVFLLPVLCDLLSRAGVLNASLMKRFRRHALLLMAVLAAVITPPDAVSMVLVLLPLYGLYELSIRIAARH